MLMYIQFIKYKVFHAKHCTYTRYEFYSQLQPLVPPQLMHL